MLVWRNGAIYFSLVFGSEIACVISSAVWGFQKDDHRVYCLGALQNVVIEHMTLNLVVVARNPETEILQKLTSSAHSNVVYIPSMLVPVWRTDVPDGASVLVVD
ncbi:hypothetical protein FS842_002380 [Serendipita sp. 407]|nr:hypothetical protein FRC15_004187 [Serendipita sp. 397]KAG9041947.1 hypothetical protein FS842_002380 [Serendipita sp. 407]